MTPFRHWSIRRRLVLAFLGMLVPLLALAAAGAVATALVQEAFDAVQDETVELKAAGDFRYALGRVVDPVQQYVINPDPRHRTDFEEALRAFHVVLQRMDAFTGLGGEDRRLIGEVRSRMAEIERRGRELLSLADARREPATLSSS